MSVKLVGFLIKKGANMVDSVIGTLLILVIAGLQYILGGSVRFKYSGAIIPVLFALFMLYMYLFAHKAGFWAFLVILIVGEILLLSIWDNRYETRQRKLSHAQTHKN